jgi:two-component system OmpR family response regulator
VILDVMLPEMDGFEVCRTIRRARTSALPVLMLTARGELMDRVVGLELGADDYLPKPFEPRELAGAAADHPAARAAAPARGGRCCASTGLQIDLDAPRGAAPGPAGGADRHRVRAAGAAGAASRTRSSRATRS